MYELFDPRDGVARKTVRTKIAARLLTRRQLRKTRAVFKHVGPKHLARWTDYERPGAGW